MTRTPAARRPGFGLLEVLTAIFVMAVGLLSLLTLFPVGAVLIGRALQDARAAETAAQADAHMQVWWQKYVVERGVKGINNPAPNPSYPDTEDPAFAALDNPAASHDGTAANVDNNPPHPLIGVSVASTDTGPSYPVAIDPLGWQARNGLGFRQYRIAGGASGLIPRRSMFWITHDPTIPLSAGPTYPPPTYPVRLGNFQPAFSFRVATMMDDITFGENGLPNTADTQGGVVNRMGRFNWTAVIQRPNNSNRYVADLKILVFDGRSPGVAPADAEQVFNPPPPPSLFGTSPPSSTQIRLNVGANPPEHLREGSWIMDGTLVAPGATAPQGIRNALWYRIQFIDKDSSPGEYILDLQTPLIRGVTPASQFYVFKGLMEVFDRPQLAPPGYKKQP